MRPITKQWLGAGLGAIIALGGVGSSVYFSSYYSGETPQAQRYFNAKKTLGNLESQITTLKLGNRLSGKNLLYLTEEIKTAVDPILKVSEYQQKIISLERGVELVQRDISNMEEIPEVKKYNNGKDGAATSGMILGMVGLFLIGFLPSLFGDKKRMEEKAA